MTAPEIAAMAKEAEDILNFNWCYNEGKSRQKGKVCRL